MSRRRAAKALALCLAYCFRFDLAIVKPAWICSLARLCCLRIECGAVRCSRTMRLETGLTWGKIGDAIDRRWSYGSHLMYSARDHAKRHGLVWPIDVTSAGTLIPSQKNRHYASQVREETSARAPAG